MSKRGTGKALIQALVNRLVDLNKPCYDSEIVILLRSLSKQQLNQIIAFGDVTEWHNERVRKEMEVQDEVETG